MGKTNTVKTAPKTNGKPKTAPAVAKGKPTEVKPKTAPKTETKAPAPKTEKPKTAPQEAPKGKSGPSAELLAKVNKAARAAFENGEGRDVTGCRKGTRARIINAVLFGAVKPLRMAELKSLLADKTYTHPRTGEASPIQAVERHVQWLMGERAGGESGPAFVERIDGGYTLTKLGRKSLADRAAGK